MNRLAGFALIALAVTASAASFAQHDHAGHQMGGSTGKAEQAFEAANARMHQAMAITYSGNADIDFARGMIAHHQGAIDMAKVVLEHGTDPSIRKLAEDIIAAQEKEIGWMEGWLKKKGQ
jgi:uncharacterized protein (DUF305 family)